MGHHRRTTYSFYQPRCALVGTAVAKHLEEGILPYVPQPTASDYHHSSAEQPSLPLSLYPSQWGQKGSKKAKILYLNSCASDISLDILQTWNLSYNEQL